MVTTNFLNFRALQILVLIFICITSNYSYSWNSSGHKLIAQIALDNLKPDVRKKLIIYNQALNTRVSPPYSLVKAATWLDYLKVQDIHHYDKLHYINMQFSNDNTKLTPADKENAVSAILDAITTLHANNTSDYDKGIALRILLHVVGDIHQPLHATSRVSRRFPHGDRGGNLLDLPPNKIANSLHKYWDRAGGYLNVRKHQALIKKARKLNEEYPCANVPHEKNPMHWAQESHELGKNIAYKLLDEQSISNKYQRTTIKVAKKRLAQAGCRLAYLLNMAVD